MEGRERTGETEAQKMPSFREPRQDGERRGAQIQHSGGAGVCVQDRNNSVR